MYDLHNTDIHICMYTRHNTWGNNSYSTERRRDLEMSRLTSKRTESMLSQISSARRPKLNPIRHQQFEHENVPSCRFHTDSVTDSHPSGIGP